MPFWRSLHSFWRKRDGHLGLSGSTSVSSVANVKRAPRTETLTLEAESWHAWRSFSSGNPRSAVICALASLDAWISIVGTAAAQEKLAQPVASSGSSFPVVKSFLEPLLNVIALLVSIAVDAWNYVMGHPPAAVLLSATAAAIIAIKSIKTTRSVTRLRETFNNLNAANWDRDMIEARKVYANLLLTLSDNPQSIAEYCRVIKKAPKDQKTIAYGVYQKDEKGEIAETLMTILNEYEILSLGVRMGIVDEGFLFKSLRGTILRDWKNLRPLVEEYRRRYSSDLMYIEFEGLSNAWDKNRSYVSGKKMKLTTKNQHFS